MYAVTPAVADAWRALLAWVAAHAHAELDYVDHAAPLPLDALWRRADLGCTFMCGYPWATWPDATSRPAMLGAIVPSPSRYADRPVYCTDVVVCAEADIDDADALGGRRFAFTTPSSQSGYQAPRAFFAAAALARGGALFAATVGPLMTPRAVVDAVLRGDADAGPLDGYWHDLLRRHEPATAARLRTVASTPWTPLPPLVCAAGTPADVQARLAAALVDAGSAPALRDVREALLIARIAAPRPAGYAILRDNATHADALGYRTLR